MWLRYVFSWCVTLVFFNRADCRIDELRVLGIGDDKWDNAIEDDLRMHTIGKYSHQPQYLVVASKIVRPGQVFRVAVTILSTPQPLRVRASIHCDGEEVAAGTEHMDTGDTELMLMEVPYSVKPGNYRLRVEGNVNGILGGTGFRNETELEFSLRFLTILIQTNKLVYNFDDTIRIRVVLLTTELKPYADPVDVFLVDSRGYIMKRWVSVYPHLGFVSVNFVLPKDFPHGWWIVRVAALGQIEEKKILVERWFTHRFDVNVIMPAFVLNSEEYLEGTVMSNHTNVALVHGNATIRAYVRPLSQNQDDHVWRKDLFLQDNVLQYYGVYDFSFSMANLRRLAGSVPLENCEVEVQAKVGEHFYDIFVMGYARARIINDSLNLHFLGPPVQIFKPGMPFTIRLAVSYHDSVPLSEERLSASHLTIEPSAILGLGGRRILDRIDNQEFDSNGIVEIEIATPVDAAKIEIQARYEDEDGSTHAQMTLLAHYSEKNRYLQVTSSTKVGQAGEYAVFHVRSNFHLKQFTYLVISKGIILMMGTEQATGLVHSITTFAVPLSPEMAPSCTLVVYHVTPDGEVISDSMILPINAINRVPFVLDVNTKQDRTGNIIELIPTLTTEARLGISGVDVDMLATQGHNDLSMKSVLKALYGFEKFHAFHRQVLWRDREGGPEKIQYFSTPNVGRDANKTFSFASLVVFTNMNIRIFPSFCSESEEQSECLDGRCYPADKKCDGHQDCNDGSDETGCEGKDESDMLKFYLYRKNRQNSFIDATAADFAWHDVVLGHQQNDFIQCPVPKGPSTYRFNAIGISKTNGLVILEEPPLHDSARPFFMTAEAPDIAIIGEQIGIKTILFNFQREEIIAEVVLEGSDSYKFVQVEPFGVVSARNPRTTLGEHQHLVYIKPYSHFIVYIPVVATVKGEVKVTITGRTQVAKDTIDVFIEILPDGAPMTVHTSLLLDMQTEAYNIKFLNLSVLEDPIIPLEETYRHYLFGSASARVSVIGDVVGAPLPVDDLVDVTDVGHTYAVKSGDHVAFNFAYNLHTLIYLRLTNQMDAPVTKKVLEYLNQAYVLSMVFYKDNAFTMFMTEPSTWLTAYFVRIFHLAQYPDWENHLYIDPSVIEKSVRYLIRQQTSKGSFLEEADAKSRKETREHWSENYQGKVQHTVTSLTAHVLITLSDLADMTGELRGEVSTAKKQAVLYLESQLPGLTHPYEIAIVTYALMQAGSEDAQVGFYKLETIKRSTEGLVYWSPVKIPPPYVIYQNQRPFLQPRLPQYQDSVAVEATSYALMVYIHYGGLYQEQIIKWLNSVRMFDVGFISTQDTIVAMQALIEYSYRTHVRDVTNMQLHVESSSNAGNIHTILVSSENLAQKSVMEIEPNVWGHVEVSSQGTGLSVLQLDVTYSVDRDFLLLPSPIPAFDLKMREYYHGRNKSQMNIECCAKWLLTEESETSGIAVIEILLPTGYDVYKPTLDSYIWSRTVPHLQRGRVIPRTAVFMFDYLENEWTCVNFTVERWFPVANLTRYLKAKVYDYYSPELSQEIIYEVYSLFVLNICEVCGSYQCPYCPYFSGAVMLKANVAILLFILLYFINSHML